MAKPTNMYDRYNAGTNVREDLIDAITNTDPDETPVLSAFGRHDPAANTFHEWNRDTLRAANKDNALIDGDTFAASVKAQPARVGNYCQVFADVIGASRRANLVKKAGAKKADAYFIAKAYKELQRDMEAMVVSSNAAVAGTTGTASKSAGAGAMIYSNVSHGAGGSTPTHASGAATVAPTAGTARAFTEVLLKAVVQLNYTAAGKIARMICLSPSHKDGFSAFTGIAVNRYNVDKKEQGRIIGGADVYMSNFGELTVVPHYLMSGASTVFGFNPDYGGMSYLDGFKEAMLGKTSDGDQTAVTADVALVITSEKAHFKIADLTP